VKVNGKNIAALQTTGAMVQGYNLEPERGWKYGESNHQRVAMIHEDEGKTFIYSEMFNCATGV